jgi:hypothetical protein
MEVIVDQQIREMAWRCYGYGHWEAPYWFIGPEQGQVREENDDLKLRCEAWLHFGGTELSDCRAFHDYINQKAGRLIHPWHQQRPLQRLQSTWRRLMFILMAFLERPTDDQSLYTYQRDNWGMIDGETCVIELSGLPANSFAVRRNRREFRSERIAVIRQRMHTHNPALVVMYGKQDKKHWEEISEGAFPPNGIQRLDSTILAFTPHPSRPSRPPKYWMEWGERLRQVTNHL